MFFLARRDHYRAPVVSDTGRIIWRTVSFILGQAKNTKDLYILTRMLTGLFFKIDWLNSVLFRIGNISTISWSVLKYWSFPVALTSILFWKFQRNGRLRAKRVVILDTGHHLTYHPTIGNWGFFQRKYTSYMHESVNIITLLLPNEIVMWFNSANPNKMK